MPHLVSTMPEREGSDPKPAPCIPDKVRLRNTETGKVVPFFIVDAREILATPGTIDSLSDNAIDELFRMAETITA